MRVLSVSQINFFIKSLIEGDGRMRDIYARGEISNFTDHYRSGHLYFSLKDEKSVLKAVMFSSAARRLRFHPKEGMRVIVRGRVAVYEPGGQYQFYVEEMQPDGVTEYIGNYDDYIERKNRPVAVEAEAGKTKTELEKEKRREKLSRQALRQLKIRAQEAEKAVGVKEAEIAELEAQMADPSLYSDAQKSADVQRAYQKAQQALQTLYEQWKAAEAALSQEEA